VDVPVYAEPYGNVDAIQKYKTQFPGTYFSSRRRAPAEEQYISLLASFYLPLWNRSLVYDPDVRIDLLFDPVELPDAAPTVVNDIQSPVVIGVVVTVVIVIFIGATVAVVVKVIFPYRAAQKAKEAAELSEPSVVNDVSENGGRGDKSSRWSSAQAPQSVRNT
jgi:hypothetical protein